MYGTIRRYDVTDETRSSELVAKVKDRLVPQLSELPGFNGYFLIEAGNGIMSSVSFFDTAAHAEESTQVASDWVRESELESMLPHPPKITIGEVVVRETRELVQAYQPWSRSASVGGPAIRGPSLANDDQEL
jgi:hypothetical protein